MNNKIISFDIDGTLISYGEMKFSNKIIETFNLLKEKKYIIILASGRDLIAAENLIKQYNKLDFFIGSNGSFIYDIQSNKILSQNSLQYQDIKTIINKFNLETKNIFISNNENAFVDYESIKNEKARSFLGIWKRTNKAKLKKFENIESLDKIFQDQEINLFILRNLSEIQKIKIRSFLLENSSNLIIKKETNTGLYVQNINQNKYNAILNLAALKNLDISNLIAFGDGWNDFEMIKFAKHGIAMGNSDSSLIKIADNVAPSVENNGVYFKLKEMGII